MNTGRVTMSDVAFHEDGKLPIMLPSGDFIRNIERELQPLQLLCSPMLKDHLPEIVDNMAAGKLMHRIDKLNDVLRCKWLSIWEANVILDFYRHVLAVRKDAAILFTEDTIPIVLHLMVEAEQADRDSPWLSASAVLYRLASHYMEITILELQHCIQASSSCPLLSALTTLAAVLSYPNVPPTCLGYVLPTVYSLMEAATDPGTRRILSMVMHNAALTLGCPPALQPGIQLYCTKACALLNNWSVQHPTNAESAAVITSAISQLETLLAPPSLGGADHDSTRPPLIPFGIDKLNQLPALEAASNSSAEDFAKSLVQSGQVQEIMGHLMPLSPIWNQHFKTTITAICAALLAYPNCVTGALHDDVTRKMLHLLDDPDTDICLKVLECISNNVRASPRQALAYRNLYITSILQRMEKHTQTLLPELLRTLVLVVQLRRHKTWRKYNEVLHNITAYMDYRDRNVQLHAVTLFGELVDRYHVSPCSPIKEIIKEHLVSVMIKLESPDKDITSAAVICLNRCLPHLGCKTIALAEGTEWHDSRYQHAVYRKLARKHLLKPVLLQTTDRLILASDLEGTVRHIAAIMEYIPDEELTATDYRNMWRGLRKADKSGNPDMKMAARTAGQVVGRSFPAPVINRKN